MTDPLAAQRAEIDAIDDKIIALLARRYAILAEVVNIKAAHGISHHVEQRVQQVLNRNEAAGVAAGLPPGYAHALWTLIIDAAHEFEGQHLPY